MEVNIYEAIRSLQAEVNSLKQRNEEIISSLNKEIEDLKEIVTQMKNELQDKESCMLSYFGPNQGNYPYSIWRAEIKKQNSHSSICLRIQLLIWNITKKEQKLLLKRAEITCSCSTYYVIMFFKNLPKSLSIPLKDLVILII